MKNLQSVCIIVMAIVAMINVAYADAEVIDLATGGAVVENQERIETPPVGGTRQHTVLWDTTHGVYLNYQPFGRYNILVTNLAASGFTISLCGTGLHTVDLTQYDVIVINVGSSWFSPYTQEEVDSLLSYYNQYNQRVLLTGDMNFCEDTYIYNADNRTFSENMFTWLAESGGILIMGDNPGCSNVNINPVANAFNMTAGVGGLSPSDLYFSSFTSNPIFNGIDTIYYRAAGEVAATIPSEPIAWTDTNLPTIAALDEFVGVVEGKEETIFASRLMINPNPFYQSAEIQGMTEQRDIHIFDVTGRLVLEQQNSRIGETLKEGVYFVQVEGFAPEKIIKLK
jgi:hypothetical protein